MEHCGHIQGQGTVFSPLALSVPPPQHFLWHLPRQHQQPQLGAAGRLSGCVGCQGWALSKIVLFQFNHGSFSKKMYILPVSFPWDLRFKENP